MSTIVQVPALRGKMGGRIYYTLSMKLKTVPRFFEFQNHAALEPEQRAQRVINKLRVPQIRDYLLQNSDGYVFSAITASYQLPEGVGEDDLFEPTSVGADIGLLRLPMDADLLINDGQHRRAGIAAALEEDPRIGEDVIAVVLFPFEDSERAQQMFSDLNRTASPTTKSLNILYDHRDRMSNITMTLTTNVSAFVGRVDKERASLSKRSPALITLGSLHDGTKELLGEVTEDNAADKTDLAIAFWQTVAANLPAWVEVAEKRATAPQIRETTIATHAVTIRAIGEAGRTLIAKRPSDWASVLGRVFANTDWSRQNPDWQGVVVSDGDVTNRRQNQRDLAELLRVKLDIGTVDEQLRRAVHAISHTRPELALTARLRAEDTRDAALHDVADLEREARVPEGTAGHLQDLIAAAYAA